MNNSTSILPKLVGETKHYPPAVKEWNNSVYTYNKNFLKTLPSKDIMASKIIKGYFNLSDCKHLARSKRMRGLIRKLSANRIFVGRPEFKQTNDNIAITIYTLDRERQILLRKIYHNIRKWDDERKIKGIYINKNNSYENWRNKYSLNKSLRKLENNILTLSTKNNLTKVKQINNKYLFLAANKHVSLSQKTKQLFNVNRAHYLKTRDNIYTLKKIRKDTFFKNTFLARNSKKRIFKKKSLPYFGIRSLSEVKFLRHISQFKHNSIQARKRIYYHYIKRILFLLGIKVLSFDMLNINKENKKIIQHIQDSNYLRYQGKVLLFFSGKQYDSKPEVLDINNIQENLPYLDKVNLVLSNFVTKILSNNNLVKKENLSLSLANFSKINFQNFLQKEYKDLTSKRSKKLDYLMLKKEISLLKDYINIKINNFKFSKYLPALKLLISKIYNKNVQLNIVKLKYLYLNSDILIEAILLKFRKKFSFSTLVKKSLKMIKIPSDYNDISNSVNNIQNLNVYKSLKLKNLFASKDNNLDNLDLVIKNIYPLSLIHQQKKNNIQGVSKDPEYTSSKLTDVINVVKYKWVSGIRLEAAGRLTRRYAASRSVYKYINKGSLKNTDFSRKLDFLKKSMPVVMFRNNTKTNSQYTFANSKKRIGAFGLKGWISSY